MDPGGAVAPLPSNGTKFFHFHMHYCRKAPMSEVGAPTPETGRRPPQQEILDPPLISNGIKDYVKEH